MKFWKNLYCIFFVLVIQGTGFSAQQVCDGIEYRCIVKTNTKIHVLKIQLSNPKIIVRTALAHDQIGRLETTTGIAKRNKAIAAINGSFFDRRPGHLPIGLLIIDGQILTKSWHNRSAMGLTTEKKTIFGIPQISCVVTNLTTGSSFEIWGLNRPRKDDEIILYTDEYGDTTGTNKTGVEITVENDQVVGISDGDSEIPENGYVVSFHGKNMNHTNKLPPAAPVSVDYKLSDGWQNVLFALTGGPRLLENGKVVVDEAIAEENFRYDLLKKHARTAVGVDRQGNLLLMAVDGRRSKYKRKKRGVSYTQLADFFKEVDAVDAIALDGGGESTMYINGKVVNRSDNGYVQKVSNALIIKLKDN